MRARLWFPCCLLLGAASRLMRVLPRCFCCVWQVEGARVQSRDEADLIKQAKKQLQLHKQATQKLSRCAEEGRCKCLGEAWDLAVRK